MGVNELQNPSTRKISKGLIILLGSEADMVNYDERLIGVLKTFFVLNEGEWFSSSEIVSFIQKNKSLGLGRTVESITTGKIGMLLRRNLFSDLETKEISSTNKGKRYRWTQK